MRKFLLVLLLCLPITALAQDPPGGGEEVLLTVSLNSTYTHHNLVFYDHDVCAWTATCTPDETANFSLVIEATDENGTWTTMKTINFAGVKGTQQVFNDSFCSCGLVDGELKGFTFCECLPTAEHNVRATLKNLNTNETDRRVNIHFPAPCPPGH